MMLRSGPVWAVENLRKSLRILAADAEDQVAHLKDLGDAASVDELALDFDNDRRVVLSWKSELGLGPKQIHCIEALDGILETMSGDKKKSLWTRDALKWSQEWATVRKMAARALKLLK